LSDFDEFTATNLLLTFRLNLRHGRTDHRPRQRIPQVVAFMHLERPRLLMQLRDGKQDIYARITAKIVAALEDGVRPWVRPWNAEHAAGRMTRPLRHNGQPYTGINILSLWVSASVQGLPHRSG
jgi:hypothetical protein